MTVLFYLASPWLEQVLIDFDHAESSLQALDYGNISEDATSAFHACLARGVFVGLGQRSVRVTFGLQIQETLLELSGRGSCSCLRRG